ncbi:hypothetical protein [Burkholderia lata]|uniref:hypothetical protein n=1 Tax=Burkholderia lata (strain ATCC 17760 / DSM 23089 / LMG 22485 / NCIMB 9086 / R18194 / 383) TaxID=482957 RepID=UPI0015837DCD|nr:hypothetical protein [Burkholderia lata]
MRHSPLLFRIEALRTAPAARSAIKCVFHFDDDLFVILSMICALLFPISVPGAFKRIYRKGRSESGKPATSVAHRRDRLPADASARLRRSATTIVCGARVAALTYLDGTGRALPQTFFRGPSNRPSNWPSGSTPEAGHGRQRAACNARATKAGANRAARCAGMCVAPVSCSYRLPRLPGLPGIARARSPANVLPPRRQRARRVTLPLRAARQSSGFNREVFVTFR